MEDELTYLGGIDHLTLVRIWLAMGGERPLQNAATLLNRLRTAAEAGDRTGSLLEILILQARAHAAQSDTTAAQAALARALSLAAPEGYVRLFVDEGLPMAALLARQKAEGSGQKAEGGGQKAFVAKLLAAFAGQEVSEPAADEPPLLDPLSDRELEVLQLVAEELEQSARLPRHLPGIKHREGAQPPDLRQAQR
ncbi:MAG: hypothetical protein R3D55_24925 [Chloroflexota bacterium]